MQGAGGDAADLEGVAVAEQLVELAAVTGEARFHVEQGGEGVLHRAHLLADGQAAAELGAQVVAGTQVVGMHMGFQDPLHAQALFADVGDHPLGAGVGGAAGSRIVIEHGVDQGALAAVGIGHHVAVGAGGGVEEGHDLQLRGCVATHADTPRGIQGEKSTGLFGACLCLRVVSRG